MSHKVLAETELATETISEAGARRLAAYGDRAPKILREIAYSNREVHNLPGLEPVAPQVLRVKYVLAEMNVFQSLRNYRSANLRIPRLS